MLETDSGYRLRKNGLLKVLLVSQGFLKELNTRSNLLRASVVASLVKQPFSRTLDSCLKQRLGLLAYFSVG